MEVEVVLYNLHSDPTAGHFAFDATYERIKTRYFWHRMYRDIKNYVDACQVCQKFGGGRQATPLHPLKTARPFDRLGIDLVGPLPLTKQGNRYLVVATEYVTKWPEVKAIPAKTALEVATFLYHDIICRHGCPRELLSDQGKEFCNEVINELCAKFRIRYALSSPYHPQTNGLVERFNQTLCHTLAKYAEMNEQEWDCGVETALLAYRTRKHAVTRHEPFYLIYGRTATLPVDLELAPYPTESPEEEEREVLRRAFDLLELLPEKLAEASLNIKENQDKVKKWYDGKISKSRIYQKNDLVWLFDAQRSASHS